MNKYENYKPVELGWLDRVPAHWEVRKLKHVAGLNSGNTITAETIHPEGPYPVFGGNGLRGYTDSLTHEGHFVLIGRQGALCGNINYAQGAFFASEHALVATPKVEFATTWLGELLRSMNLGQYSQAAAQPGLSADRLQQLVIPVPPLPEQRAIAAYLDHKTAQLDTLLAQKKTLLRLLHQKRQALINEAVTQGLDPAAPRKPSGVAWLGDVPAHWEVKKLKHVANLNSGNTITAESIDEEGAHPVYGGNGLRGYTSTFTHDGHYALIGRQGHLCGNINYAQGRFFASEHALVVSLKGEYETVWLGELLRTMNLGQYSQAAAQPGLSADRLVNLSIPVPPLVEQKAIVNFIDAKTGNINEAATAIHTQIKTLKAYRQSLISEVVTGKVDVRTEAQALAGTAPTPSPTRQASQPARPAPVGQLGLF